MARYFLEVSYKGTAYSGFQSQENANSIQGEIEKAYQVLQREPVLLTGSSRTDAGVHALQNYFHFDSDTLGDGWGRAGDAAKLVYKLNAILPPDIVIRRVFPVAGDAHCRFDAISREYKYFIYREKNAFLRETAYYFPYRLDREKMQAAAEMLRGQRDFRSFSKRNTQVKNFECRIELSEWGMEHGCLVYRVRGNRFLRGMVRAMTATMLRVGRGIIGLEEFGGIMGAGDCTKASFAVPAQGLFLVAVDYGAGGVREV